MYKRQAVTGLLCFIGMSLFGFKYAVFISAIIGLTAIVPIFGSWIGGGAALIIFVIVAPESIIWFLLFFVLLRVVERYLIFPFVIKNKVNLPAIWVIFSVTFLGTAFGIVGMLLAVPVVAIFYELLADAVRKRNAEKKKPVPEKEKEKALCQK